MISETRSPLLNTCNFSHSPSLLSECVCVCGTKTYSKESTVSRQSRRRTRNWVTRIQADGQQESRQSVTLYNICNPLSKLISRRRLGPRFADSHLRMKVNFCSRSREMRLVRQFLFSIMSVSFFSFRSGGPGRKFLRIR